MAMSIAELIRKAAGPIGDGDFATSGSLSLPGAAGTLNPEQATAFLDLVYETTPLLQLVRQERRRVTSGSIAKIGIGGRLLRKKTAGVDDSTLAKPTFGEVDYQTVRTRLDWEIEEEVFQDNIEQEGFEDHLMTLMTAQVGRDLEDLHINGNTSDTSADAPFLTINQGWLARFAASSETHRTNGGSINSGSISKDHFFTCVESVPNKYKVQGGMRWLLSPTNIERYAQYLSNRSTPGGDAVLLNGEVTQILGYPVVKVPAMPNDRIEFVNPNNLIAVNTRDIRVRRTVEGREAIRTDKRFYAIFLDDDPIEEIADGIGDIYGLDA